jgi:soluble lytic murein transglycosylase-like protein
MRKVAYLVAGLAALVLHAQPAAAYEPAVEQWRGAVDEACAANGCSTDYLLSIIACESGGDPNAVSVAINPGTGDHDYGLLQVSTIWGGQDMGPVEQIWFASEHAGRDIWWVCAS